jgi:hypothetical protein
MHLIQATFKEVASRGEKVRVLLEPLTPANSSGPAWEPKFVRNSYIIGTHDGARATTNYRDWRFNTFVPKTYASYFEKWDLLSDDQLCLNRAYLSIFQLDIETRSEREFLCLHCDPNEPDNEPHAIYKKGPHLHIVAALNPIPRAHIPLNMVHLQTILSSIETLSEAIESAVVMLKEEILNRLLNI